VPHETEPLDLVFVGRLPPHAGGSAISCWQLLCGLAASGVRVRSLAYRRRSDDASDEFAKRHPQLGVHRFTLPPDYPRPYVVPTPQQRRALGSALEPALEQLISERLPRMLLVGAESYAEHVCAIAERYHLPWMLMVRGSPTVQMLAGDYPPSECERLLGMYRRAALITTPARYISTGLIEAGCTRVRTVANAVDVAQFAAGAPSPRLRDELGFSPSAIVIVLAAGLHPRKRPLDVVEALAVAIRRHPELVLLVVGDGELRETLEEAAAKRGLGERVRLIGWRDYREVPGYLRLADMVVMPSAAEGLSRVYLEAQACGRLLIASDLPAAREVVIDGETGLLFPVGDVAALAAAISRAAADPELRARAGARSRVHVEREHGIEQAVARYRELVAEVTQGGSAASPTSEQRHETRDRGE
jgi:glycosyltransferase involved in cell wall biosynthesis